MKTLRPLLLIALVVVVGRALDAGAQTEKIIHSFGGNPDGNAPGSPLVLGTDGNLYGTTGWGGTGSACAGGCGTVFRVGTNGVVTILHSFGTQAGDGYIPGAGLLQGSDGYFYGSTANGGSGTACDGGCGTIFRVSSSGAITILHSFTGGSDGSAPYALVIPGSDGYFYSTTTSGGADGYGTAFRISSSGTFTLLHTFAGSPNDGANPNDIVLGSDGYFYGTTANGGTNGYGTVFRMSPSGAVTLLYSFGSYDGDGWNPLSGLVQGSDGYFYGTTSGGGTVADLTPWPGYCRNYSGMSWTQCGGSAATPATYGYGTVYRISPTGNYTNLYSFGSTGSPFSIAASSGAEPSGVQLPVPDGRHPVGSLVEVNPNNFFGTCLEGGHYSNGIVFFISPDGDYQNVYSFAGPTTDGAYPNAVLARGTNNRKLYGTTLSGGSSAACNDGCGALYELDLPPCTFSVSATNILVAAGGESGMLAVDTAIACPWTAKTTYSWITITSGNSGNDSGIVHFTVAANPGTSQRIGTMTVAGQTVTVTESGTTSSSMCTFTLSSPSADFTAAGGPGTIGITASNGCAWEASTTNGWITITSDTGSGNGTAGYSVAANTTTIARTGMIFIAGQTLSKFTVLQAAGSASSVVYNVLSSDSFKMSGMPGAASILSQNSQTCTFTSSGTSGRQGSFDLCDGRYHYTGSYFVFGKHVELILDANGLSAVASNTVDLIESAANNAGVTLADLSVSVTHVTMSNISMKYGVLYRQTTTIHGTASAVVDGKFMTKSFTHKAVKTNWNLISGPNR
ncbi:MAG TPA: choice-of-anchor tandem repeat GloVer-containing protein [Verrucomicrobiae bacterium]|nr:choice-of-anchor tandem repeat GloVer-containing protein [Verrucomicrobiae bacterium]